MMKACEIAPLKQPDWTHVVLYQDFFFRTVFVMCFSWIL